MSAAKLREAAELFVKLVNSNYQPEYARRSYEVAINACTTLAAQMESSAQTFDEWHNDLNRTRYGNPEREAWYAAQAAMQAKLDALTESLSLCQQSAMAQMDLDTELRQQLDAANERVKHLEGFADFTGNLRGELAKSQSELSKASATLATSERERELLRGYISDVASLEDYERWCEARAVTERNRSPEVRALVEQAGPSGATG